MGGFANLTTAEIEELTSSVADTAVVMGGDAVTSVDEYDAAMRDMRDIMGKVAITGRHQAHPQDHDAYKGCYRHWHRLVASDRYPHDAA